jgi:hypothetical protein
MKNILRILIGISLLWSCNKDLWEEEQLEMRGKKPKKNEVLMCRPKKDGSYDVDKVKAKDIEKKLEKGFYLLDADNDGFTAVGACSGSKDDCDDNNSDVYPGSAEICDNEIDDDCDGFTDCDDVDCSESCVSECPCFTEVDLACSGNLCLYDDGAFTYLECSDSYFLASISLDGSGSYYVQLSNLEGTICNIEYISSTEYNACKALLLSSGGQLCGGETLKAKVKQFQLQNNKVRPSIKKVRSH